MKRHDLISLTLALSLLSGCAAGAAETAPRPLETAPGVAETATVCATEAPPEPTAPVEMVVTTCRAEAPSSGNGLALRLLEAECSQQGGENVILSPLSIQMALGMAANGADGQAKEDLETLLGMDASTVNTLLGSYMEKDDDTLSIANSMWFNKDLDGLVDQGFKDTLKTTYAAGEGSFTPYSEADAAAINGWVKEKTHDKIDSIVTPDALTEDALAVLINALYFNGKWAEPFEDYQVEKGKFRAQGGEEDAELMTDRVKTYFESEGFTGFAKSYEDGYEFIGILPEQEGDVDLSALDIDGFFGSETTAYDVDIKIPKFELEYANSLKETLKVLGLGSLFEDGSMDGLLTDAAKANGGEAHISDVVHKTYMKMYEAGTEAAAVTAAMFNGTTALPARREVKQVYLDRPFAFLIRDANGQIVFCGAIHSVA